LKKQANYSEDLLLEMSSYHSEYDSVDLSEKQMNDESFKLKSHAFSKVQTMDQINDRHHDDEPIQITNPSSKLIDYGD
jgi:hypothetical protein